jgi:murein DD-endopeptidase MepM/ murein hydrolase activator NlpD
VRAAADGEVVYRGSELDGFGNLLLVKHTDGFVTAYAHNDAMLVKKGQHVSQGQVIAKVGQSGAVSSPQLHFEIRQNLKSVDPAALLGSQ